jgi:hypothetical protein
MVSEPSPFVYWPGNLLIISTTLDDRIFFRNILIISTASDNRIFFRNLLIISPDSDDRTIFDISNN